MEIKFLNVSYKKEHIDILKNINMYISDNKITGIYHDDYEVIPNIIMGSVDYQGRVLIDNQELKGKGKGKGKSNLENSKRIKRVSYIKELDNDTFLTSKVSDEFYLMKKSITSSDKDYIDKVISVLKMVGLDNSYLKRDINTLSKSDKRLLEIALNLITNPDILIITEPFLYLNKNKKFNIKKILLDLRKKYKKTIIILSNEINVLYELTDNLIILKDGQVLVNDRTKLIFKDYNVLEKNQIALPDLVLFSKIALEYNKKIDNYLDVNDLIKGVYKVASKTKDD